MYVCVYIYIHITHRMVLNMAISFVDLPIKHGDFPWPRARSPRSKKGRPAEWCDGVTQVSGSEAAARRPRGPGW